MTKDKIETFIKKYSLGNSFNEARWISKDGSLKVAETTPDKKIMTSVEMNGFDAFDDTMLVVLNTQKLKSMIGCLSDNISFTLNRGQDDDKRVISIDLSDENVQTVFVTGDE